MKTAPRAIFGIAALLAGTFSAVAQTASPALLATPHFELPENALTIHNPAVPNRPFTVTGTSGTILGMQDGTVELWHLPLKFFSGLHLSAQIDGYPVPIDLNGAASRIDVSPDHTTITYSHANITVRQHMFVPAGEGNNGLGGMILFEIQSIRPATLTVALQPAMVLEWPAAQHGQPGWDWHPMGSGGAYSIATDDPTLFGMIGMPNATPGDVSPYQERPRALPLVFKVRYDPAHDGGRLFPLLCEAPRPGERNSSATTTAMQQRMIEQSQSLPEIYGRTKAYYDSFFSTRLIAHTPDKDFDKALQWAELSIDKAQVRTPEGEIGLVAGWYPSFDSARPGFGWFFGRDTLWSMYAIDSYGDAALARRALDFLIKRQRVDGKMMHEYSQSASLLTGDYAWSKLPYEYAAADGTPLYLLAMQDYVRATGDMDYLRKNWDSVQRAYKFERMHDSDGDGVYDNSQGTGWVEDWPAGQPHQELYLAALDRDATLAMVQLARWMNDTNTADSAKQTAAKLAQRVAEYHTEKGLYAFSKNSNGTFDNTLTVYPSVAFWGTEAGLPDAKPTLAAWAGHSFETDWGTRAVSENDPTYDPISYHRGSVWPLFTGWTSMAEYRTNHPIAGWQALQHNLQLTWIQDPGAVTELLSGRFYQPLGRSSTHQLWSSAMTLSPALRGLFGLEPDATHHTLILHPHLPPSWDHATLEHVRVGTTMYTVKYQRTANQLSITAKGDKPDALCLIAQTDLSRVPACKAAITSEHKVTLPLPAIEAELLLPPTAIGDETKLPHVIAETYTAGRMTLTIEAMAGSSVQFSLRNNTTRALKSDDGELRSGVLNVSIPAGSGFVTKTVTVE